MIRRTAPGLLQVLIASCMRRANPLTPRMKRACALVVAALLSAPLVTATAEAASRRDVTEPAPLKDASFWRYDKYLGEGTFERIDTPEGTALEFKADGEQGMAASVQSPSLRLKPSQAYLVEMQIRTEDLEPITAKLVGAVYFQFTDLAGNPGGWYPTTALFGEPAMIAPRQTDWTTVRQVIKTPTTAGAAVVHLTYAAYGTWSGGHPRVTGRARGRLWIRDVKISEGAPIQPPAVTIRVPDRVIQQGLEVAATCLHNASLGGRFVVSDGYTISGNIVPDLTFGLFGVRRLDEPQLINLMRAHWRSVGETINQNGRVTSQRVMAQVLWPLGVDEIYAFTGDRDFLAESLTLADRALGYVIRRTDADGLARLVEYGQWSIGEGADWVDWYPTRMEGKTLMFHQWYVRALQRMAALHEQSAPIGIGSLELATQYRELANRVMTSIRRLYWRDDHFVTNIDHGGKVADERWMDDQVWAIRLGIATPEQAEQIWEWVDRDQARLEGVPTRWTAFDGPAHGPSSWFGRTGAGDILARYGTRRADHGLKLITRISEIFARDRNIYEAYDMQGQLVRGTSGWGNYTEHAGGFIWTVVAGPLGIDLDSDGEALATLRPQLPTGWSGASATIRLRGEAVKIIYERRAEGVLVCLSGGQQPRNVRVAGKIVTVGADEIQVMLPRQQ